MEKALRMGKISATGSFQLFIGVVISNVILAVGTVLLTRLLSPEEYGLYSVVLIPSMMMNLFRDWGINSALTKYVAQYKMAGNELSLHETVAAGLAFEISAGFILSLILVSSSGFVASIFNRPGSAPLISIAAVATFSGSLLAAAQSSFVGFERMELNSLTLICQGVVKGLMSPLLVLLGFGVLGAVLGYVFSFLVAGIIGSLLLYFLLLRKLNITKTSLRQTLKALRKMLNYGVPISISLILEGAQLQFYSFMMALHCSNVMIGNFKAAANFLVLLTFLTNPISTVLFPAFAKLDSKEEPQILKSVFSSSVRFTAMVVVPSTAAIMVLSRPMIRTLFGNEWIDAPLFLTLYVVGNLLSGIGSISMDGLLRGLGETRTMMKLNLLTLSIALPLAFLLIPNLGIVGVIFGTLLASLPSVFLGLYWIQKKFEVAVDWLSSAKIFAASAIAAAITYLSLIFLNTGEAIRLIGGAVVFLLAYIIMAPSIGAIVQDDVNILRKILSGFGFFSRIAAFPLEVIEKVAGRTRFLRKSRNSKQLE